MEPSAGFCSLYPMMLANFCQDGANARRFKGPSEEVLNSIKPIKVGKMKEHRNGTFPALSMPTGHSRQPAQAGNSVRPTELIGPVISVLGRFSDGCCLY